MCVLCVCVHLCVYVNVWVWVCVFVIDKMTVESSNLLANLFGPPEGGPILFLLSPEVSGTSGTMSIYIYIYIYVNNMADAKSVRNLSAIFR